MIKVTIDSNSGYCFGVEYAIQIAEDELMENKTLYCLGDIVHNDMEVKRLYEKGLRVITRDEMESLKDCKVLIRAHGEPPQTYALALKNNIELIDASCPVVLKLQNRVKNAYDKARENNGQVVIYGKKGHAEVVGLTGQTNQEAIVVMQDEDLEKIDFDKSVTLFSQTTKSTKGFYALKEKITERLQHSDTQTEEVSLDTHDSICRQVSNREPQLTKFAQEHDVILFVSGKKSSNGRALHGVCQSINPNSYFIENEDEIDIDWLIEKNSVGICGATSTPMWLMERVAKFVENNSIPSTV